MAYYSLHTHSQYSYKDALSTPYDIAMKAKEAGLDAFCITDHGRIGSFIKAYQAAEKLNLQFIPGCEAYVTDKRYHLTLIAKNQTGVDSLIKLYNNSGTKTIFGDDKNYVEDENDILSSKGLIVLSGCSASELCKTFNNNGDTLSILKKYKEAFGEDYYLECQYHGLSFCDEIKMYRKLWDQAKRLNIKAVLTSDSHYTNKDEKKYHDIYKGVHSPTKTWEDKLGFDGDNYHILNEQEAQELSKTLHIPYLLTNTIEIRNKCEETHFPHAMELKDQYNELHDLVLDAWNKRYKGTSEAQESALKIRNELATIKKMNFSEYFLNVKKIVDRSTELGVLVGAGRGSGPGSLVNYLLGITKVDPIKHHLIFERFLNPERFNMPDVDLDLASEKDGKLGKDVLIESLRDIYPFNGHILNETMATSIVLFKQMAKLMGVPFYESNKVSTHDEAVEKLKEDKYTGWLPDMLKLLGIPKTEAWDRVIDNIDFVYKYAGTVWNTGVHASGCIFYPEDILLPNKKGIPYNGHSLEEMGFIKYDILSLDALNPISEFMPMIIKDHPAWNGIFNWEDCNDKETWKTLQNADSTFVFQFSSQGMKRVLKIVKPTNIDKLAELNAIYRPGCIQSGILEKYLKNDWTPDEKIVGDFLIKEFGERAPAPVFQEDIMRICQKMAGFTLGEADLVRKAMARKLPEELKQYKDKFINGFDTRTYGNIADQVWSVIEAFSGYGFNRCLTGDTTVQCLNTDDKFEKTTIAELYKQFIKNNNHSMKTVCMDDDCNVQMHNIINIFDQGIQDVYKITLINGLSIKATLNHRFNTPDGYKTVKELKEHDKLYCCGFVYRQYHKEYCIYTSSIESIKYIGKEQTYDVEIDSNEHNFFANNICSHNSHSTAYSLIAYWQAYIFTHYKNQYMQYLLNHKKQQSEVLNYLNRKIIFPSLKTKNTEYVVTDTEILFPTKYVTNETIGEYLLNFNKDKSMSITKYGVLDNEHIDRKGLRDLANQIPKKAKDGVWAEDLRQAKTLDEFLHRLQEQDVIDMFDEDEGLKIIVKKPRSTKEVWLKKGDTEKEYAAQQDVTTFSFPRSKYVDEAPDVSWWDNVIEVFNMNKDTYYNQKAGLQGVFSTHFNNNKFKNNLEEPFKAVLSDKKIKYSAFITLIFSNNKIEIMTRDKKIKAKLAKIPKKALVEVTFSYYPTINKDNEPELTIEIKDIKQIGVKPESEEENEENNTNIQ